MSVRPASSGTAAIAAAVDAWASVDWSQVAGDEAMAALAEVERLQRRVDAARLALVERLDEGTLHALAGHRPPIS